VKASAYVPPATPAPKVAQAAETNATASAASVAKGASSPSPGSATATAAAPPSVSIYFAPKSSTLDTPAQRALRIAAAAYVGIGTEIVITGYADKSGNAAANVDLAKRRAQATRDALVKLG
jgi:outer membrane protein OmpA-like peptidoglycan-associated protein